jgi:hypothetical protein
MGFSFFVADGKITYVPLAAIYDFTKSFHMNPDFMQAREDIYIYIYIYIYVSKGDSRKAKCQTHFKTQSFPKEKEEEDMHTCCWRHFKTIIYRIFTQNIKLVEGPEHL